MPWISFSKDAPPPIPLAKPDRTSNKKDENQQRIFPEILQTAREQNTVRGILRLNGMDTGWRGHPCRPARSGPKDLVAFAAHAGAAANPSPPSPRRIASKRFPR